MDERKIWKVILWTMLATALVVVLFILDPGFLSAYLGGVVPVSTGERVEVLMVTTSPLGGRSGTELWWLEPDGSFEKAASFDPATHCVTALDGKLFVTFKDQSSGIIENGKWVRGVSPPPDFRIYDVAPLRGKLHALSMSNGQGEPVGPGTGVRIVALGEDGWERPAPAWDAGRKIWFMGCVEVADGIEVLCAEGEESFAGMLDITTAKWFHILFDGEGWGEEMPLSVPERVFPNIGSYDGELAFTLVPLDKGKPVQLAFESDGALDVACDLAPVEMGRVLSAWLVELAGEHKVILAGASAVWVVPLKDLEPGKPRQLMEISAAAKTRSYIYVGVLAVGAVMLVALGITWLLMRVSAMRRRAPGE